MPCHYGTSWCRNQSDDAHTCPPPPRRAERAQAFAEMTAETLAGRVPAPRDTIKPLLTSVFRACLDRDHPDYQPFTPPSV